MAVWLPGHTVDLYLTCHKYAPNNNQGMEKIKACWYQMFPNSGVIVKMTNSNVIMN